MTLPDTNDAIRELIGQGIAATHDHIGDSTYVYRKVDGSLRIVDLTDVVDVHRISGTLTVYDLPSFIHACNDESGDGTRVYRDDGTYTAVINDATGINDQRICLGLKTTPEWIEWVGINDRWLSTDALTEHLDNNRDHVIQPDLAELLEIVMTLQVSKNTRWSKARRLESSEVQLSYAEEVEGVAGRTQQLTIPEGIVVEVPMWEGDDQRVRLEAFFRYKLRDGNLEVKVKFRNLRDVIRAEHDRIDGEVRDETGLAVLAGRPRPIRSATPNIFT